MPRKAISSLACLLLVAGCAGAAKPTGPPPSDPAARLFTRAFEEVADYYREPRTARETALPALARLAAVDPAMAVADGNGEVALRQNGADLDRRSEPPATDAAGWGALTAALLGEAIAHSASLGALDEERRYEVLFLGLTQALDRFSRYAGPEEARSEQARREGFEGIGIILDTAPEAIRIGAVVPGSPAQRGGLEAGDHILAIDGIATAGRNREDIISRLRGPADSRITLRVRHAGTAASFETTIARAYITVPTVSERRDGAIAIIRITSFNQHTTDAVRDAWRHFTEDGAHPPRGLVLDLRGDPGGLLDQAVSVADLFLSGGRILSTSGRGPESDEVFEANQGDIAEGVPIVVLVNGGSASAAEIVAAALQDSGRAVIVGSSSYGKGTVQTVLRLPNEGELTLTSALLVAPGGYLLDRHGVVPAICTDGVGSGAAAVRRALALGAARGRGPPREQLDEAGWARLRAACPGETQEHRADLAIAEHLLANHRLYARLARSSAHSIATRPGASPPPAD